jgi:hypothetical protein
MDMSCSSETSVDFQRTVQRYIPQNINLYNDRYGNLIPYILFRRLPTMVYNTQNYWFFLLFHRLALEEI